MITFFSDNPQSTILFGKQFSKHLIPGDIVCLNGDLGAGKTTFVKGLAKGLKVSEEKVHSPTFVLMNYYKGKWPLYHFDLYRIDGSEGMQTVGFDEFFYGDGISVIEWAERLGSFIPEEYLTVNFEHKGENRRRISLSAKGKRNKQRLSLLSQEIVKKQKITLKENNIR